MPLWLGERPSWFPDEFLWVVGCSYRGLPEEASLPWRNARGRHVFPALLLIRNISGFNPSLKEAEGCAAAERRRNGALP